MFFFYFKSLSILIFLLKFICVREVNLTLQRLPVSYLE